jgi:hypothetical protein
MRMGHPHSLTRAAAAAAVATDLLPSTQYHFRIRAYNEHGSSMQAHGAFYTPPLPPPPPALLRATTTSVTLSWAPDVQRCRQLRSLLRMVAQLSEVTGGGGARRHMLLTALRNDGELAGFVKAAPADAGVAAAVLRAAAASTGLGSRAEAEVGPGPIGLTVYDCIELEESEVVSAGDIRRYLGPADRRAFEEVAGGAAAAGGGGGDTELRRNVGGRESMARSAAGASRDTAVAAVRASTAGRGGDEVGGGGGRGRPRLLAYCLMRCTRAPGGDGPAEWAEVYVGKDEARSVPNLAPGVSYAFCVGAVNPDGVPGAFSALVVVTTTIPRPAPPLATLSPAGGGTFDAAISWSPVPVVPEADGGGGGTGARGGDAAHHVMLSEWAAGGAGGAGGGGTAAAAAGGVPLRRIFAAHSRDGGESVDAEAVPELLAACGVPASRWRVDAARAEMCGGSGGGGGGARGAAVSYAAFVAWWGSKRLVFRVMRSAGVVAAEEDSLCVGGLRAAAAAVTVLGCA